MDLVKIIEKRGAIEFWFQFPEGNPLRRVVVNATMQQEAKGIDTRQPEGNFHFYVPYYDTGGSYWIVHITTDLHFAPRRIVPHVAIRSSPANVQNDLDTNRAASYYCTQCGRDRAIAFPADQRALVAQHFEAYGTQSRGSLMLAPEIICLDPHEDATGAAHVVELVLDQDCGVKPFLRNAIIVEPELIPR
jgi:hypothetical protein